MDNLGQIGRSLMDNWGKIRQLINILFCGYRRLEIHDPWQMYAETYTRLGTGAPASKKDLGNSSGNLLNISIWKLNCNTPFRKVKVPFL
jgi:hypothetical protein